MSKCMNSIQYATIKYNYQVSYIVQEEMSRNLKQDLLHLAQSITTNIHYPCNLGNLNILFEYQFYFDICQIIFPNIGIQLLKIKEDNTIQPTLKMDLLLQLIIQETQYDITSIRGAEIIKGQNISHLHRFLQVLEKFSEIYQAKENQEASSRRVRSDPNTSSRMQQKKKTSMSAREKRKNQTISQSEDEQEMPKMQQSTKKSRRKKVPSYSTAKKEMRTRSETCKNLYSSLVNIMMNEKNRAIKASMRDNRKSKNQDIVAAKNKYKSYLINYAKQNRAQKNRQALSKPQKNRNHQQLPLSQFEQIQNFFKSFQLQLRDQKHSYLKRIQKLIRTQQIDRLHHLSKLQQQQNTYIQKQTKKQLQKIQNEHNIRNTLLKQEYENQKQANKLMKKQYQRYLRIQKKQLKENKKKQLEKINMFMRQENGKVLGSLEEGGRLERIILDMYKRF